MIKVPEKIKYQLSKGRGGFRIKRILMTSVSLLGSKVLALLVAIISLPLTYNYLGEERYGMMATIVSFMSIMSFADLGLGLGLHNRVAEFEIKKDWNGLRAIVSSTFYMLVAVATTFFCFFLISSYFVDWYKIFNVHSELAKSEAARAMLVFITVFLFSIPFTIVQKLQSGLQEGYYNEIWKAGGNILGLILLFVFIRKELGIPLLILAIYGSNALFLVFNFSSQFFFRRTYLRPAISMVNIKQISLIFKEGMFFFILQATAMMVNGGDSIIIAQYLGPEQVALYAIGYRLMAILSLPGNIFTSALLPAFNDAFSQDDTLWIKSILYKLLSIVGIVSLCLGSVFILLGNFIIEVWINDTITLSRSLLFIFGLYIFYFNFSALISNVTLAPKLISFVIKVYPIAAIIVFALKLLWVESYGIEGVLFASIVGFSFFYFVPSIFKFKQLKIL